MTEFAEAYADQTSGTSPDFGTPSNKDTLRRSRESGIPVIAKRTVTGVVNSPRIRHVPTGPARTSDAAVRRT
jgi:hypothetical protein